MRTLVIIVTYNFMPWLDGCLGSLRRLEKPVDVMVIDNGSADDTVKAIRKGYKEVTVIENHANLGFGRANNIGIRYAMEKGYDAVFLLNEDAWVDPDVIRRLEETAEKHPDYGILSPVHLTGSGEKVEHGFGVYVGVTDKDRLPKEEIVEVPFIDAALWLVPLKAIKKTGMFAPLFYHYGEDKDLCNRMAYHHLKVGYVPTVFGYHDREHREQTRQRVFHAERVYMLSEFANPCYSLPMAFAKSVLASLKKALTALCHGRLIDCGSHFRVIGFLLVRTGGVIRTRRESQRGGVREE